MTNDQSTLPIAQARLGFAIPTHKRPDLLTLAVQSIIRAGRSAGVPICITDDSADDTNVAAIRSLRADYANILWVRNPHNLGIDRNILNSVDRCPTEYVWIMGEDDQVTADAVDTVLRILAEPDTAEAPFLCVNYASVDETARRVLKQWVLPATSDGWRESTEFLAHDAWAIGFIGACIVRKSLWAAVDQATYIGTYYAHVGVIMEYLRQRPLHVVAAPLVRNRCSSPEAFTWSQVTAEVLDGWGRLMDLLEPLYGEAACAASRRSFAAAHGLHTLKFLCYLRSGGALDLQVCRRWIWRARHPAWYHLAAAVVALSPPWIFRLAQRLLHRVVGRSL